MTPVSKAGIKFASALSSISAGQGGKFEIRILMAGAAVALVLADSGIGSFEDQNILVAAIQGLGRTRARLQSGLAVIFDAETWMTLHKAVYIIERQQLVATHEEVLRSLEVVLDRVMNQRKAA